MSPREFQCRSSLPSRQECSNSFTVSSFSRWNFSNVRFEKSFSTTRLLKNFQFSFNSRAHISTGFVAKYYDKNSIINFKIKFFPIFLLIEEQFYISFFSRFDSRSSQFFFFLIHSKERKNSLSLTLQILSRCRHCWRLVIAANCSRRFPIVWPIEGWTGGGAGAACAWHCSSATEEWTP